MADKKVIGIDWLQIHARRNSLDMPTIVGSYRVEKMKYQTRHFKSVYEVFDKEERIATIACDPHSEIMKANSALVKLDNKQLYRVDLKTFVESFLRIFDFHFISYSRIDLFIDFEEFNDFPDPMDFIKSFLNGSMLKFGKSKFKVQGEHNSDNKYFYLKFGSETSETTYYLYDKSKELEEVKMKPWIVDNWKANGLNPAKVWRLEFSLKSSLKEIVKKDTGEVISIRNMELLQKENYNLLFLTLLQKYFVFVENDGQQRKDRMKKINLFSFENQHTLFLRLSEKLESNRSAKIFLTKLWKLNCELRGQDFDWNIHHKRTLSDYINSRGLIEWVTRKRPEIKEYLKV